MRLAWTIILTLALLSATLPMAIATPEAAYDLSLGESTDVPERTVPIGDTRFTVSELTRTTPGEPLTVAVTVPDDTNASLTLYTSDRQIYRQVTAPESGTRTLSTTGLEPGSYLLVLASDDTARAIHPVIVSGYSVAIDAPTSAKAGGQTRVAVTVTRTASEDAPAGVSAVVFNDTEMVSATGERTGAERYEVTVPLHELSPGNYTVSATVHGEETLYGEPVSLGMSDGDRIRLTESNGTGDATAGAAVTSEADDATHSVGRTSTDDAVITPNGTVDSARSPNGLAVYLLGAGMLVVVLAGFYLRPR
ncbi:hypothetical protein [Haloarcula nitratireducens]|uniref:Cell surface protein n=1 Tax=Haloarcula nitratireducens TaxID=2487749 RepID=A0AAW4P7M2_9EURY|nr:hypothetical protein [Halomicroarcula nitratireducens]MBX0293912.1 hypothetical protein [Halomicroarcula nitratireducens]